MKMKLSIEIEQNFPCLIRDPLKTTLAWQCSCFQGEIIAQFQLIIDQEVRSIAKITNLWIKSNF